MDGDLWDYYKAYTPSFIRELFQARRSTYVSGGIQPVLHTHDSGDTEAAYADEHEHGAVVDNMEGGFSDDDRAYDYGENVVDDDVLDDSNQGPTDYRDAIEYGE